MTDNDLLCCAAHIETATHILLQNESLRFIVSHAIHFIITSTSRVRFINVLYMFQQICHVYAAGSRSLTATVTSRPDILPVAAAPLCAAFSSHYTHPSAHGSESCKGSLRETTTFDHISEVR